MAIQLPNPGLGDGQTGDNEFVMWMKVKDNFSNTDHAASRLVGDASGNVLGYRSRSAGGFISEYSTGEVSEIYGNGTHSKWSSPAVIVGTSEGTGNMKFTTAGVSCITISHSAGTTQLYNYRGTTNRLLMQDGKLGIQGIGTTEDTWGIAQLVYTTGNTTKEPTTGYLKAASPILHLFNDDLTKEHEAVEQDITVEKLGVGDYLIKGSTGLSEEGWNISPPKDIHGNVLCMVEATESDGNINIKTYKRKFDFDIVAIVPDYDQPLDIPTGNSVDLRLNDLPQETQSEV